MRAVERKKMLDSELAPLLPEYQRGSDVEAVGGAQSIVFMNQLLPQILSALATCADRGGGRIRILDVGPGAGFGSNFLGQVLATNFFARPADVFALDIDPTYKAYIEGKHPYVRDCIVGDVYMHTDVYDLVVCSHVIEHVPDPVGFLRRLQQIASHRVIFTCPFEEPAENLSVGHLHSLGDEFLWRVGAVMAERAKSAAWGFYCKPQYEVVIASLPGLADSGGHAESVPLPALAIE